VGVNRNVVSVVDLSPSDAKPTIIFNFDEARWFLEAVQDERFKALYWMILFMGIREGEGPRCRRSNLDLHTKKVRICYGLGRIPQADGRSKLQRLHPKTPASVQYLPIPDILMPILEAHLARLDEEAQCEGWQDHDLLFPTTKGTPVEAQDLIRRSFNPARDRAGLPKTTIHGLRHIFSSFHNALGTDPASISALMGHTSTQFTHERYIHAIPDVTRQAVNNLGRYVMERVSVVQPPHPHGG
jgi:integrase